MTDGLMLMMCGSVFDADFRALINLRMQDRYYIRRKTKMARRGGMPGGMPGNMNNLMKQAQRMQRQMEESQKELEEKEYEASVGGGAVKVKMSGKRELLSVELSEEVVDPDDIEMLQDLIVAAVNEVGSQIDADNRQSMSALTGGLDLGGFPF